MKRRDCLAALLAAPLAASWQQALAQAGAAAPPEVRDVLGAGARLSGAARLRWLGLSVYEARLWVAESFQPLRYVAVPLALELIYARSLKGPLIAERSIEEMRRNGPLPDEDAQRWLTFMKDTFPDVAAGDRITGAWEPAQSRSVFYVNGAPVQALRDPGFGPRFFGIWLAPTTSQPAMRQQLLGLGS
jgi:gluconate kinase